MAAVSDIEHQADNCAIPSQHSRQIKPCGKAFGDDLEPSAFLDEERAGDPAGRDIL
jgi:hypothetical protein